MVLPAPVVAVTSIVLAVFLLAWLPASPASAPFHGTTVTFGRTPCAVGTAGRRCTREITLRKLAAWLLLCVSACVDVA